MEEIGNSKESGSEEEAPPLVPNEIDDIFYSELIDNKIPEALKLLRENEKDKHSDDVQRLLICCDRFRDSFSKEKERSHQLELDIETLKYTVEANERALQLNYDTIVELKGVIETAWRQRDAAHEREKSTQDELKELKETLDEQREQINTLSNKRLAFRQKLDENKEREKLEEEIKNLNKRLQVQRSYTAEVEVNSQEIDERNKSLIKLLDETSTEAYQNKKRIEVLLSDIEQLQTEVNKQREDLATIKQQNEKLTKIKIRHHLQILSVKTNLDQLNTKYNSVIAKLAKSTIDLDYAEKEKNKFRHAFEQKTNLLKTREEEILKIRQDYKKLSKLQDATSRKHSMMEENKKHAEQETLKLLTQLNTQEKEYEAMRRLLQQSEQNCHNLTLERDALKRQMLAEQKSNDGAQQMLQDLRHEIQGLKDTLTLQERKIKKLLDELMQSQREKAKKIEEIKVLHTRIDRLQNKIHTKESHEIEFRRTMNDVKGQNLKLQDQYNQVVTENNNLQRNLQTIVEEKSKQQCSIENLQNTIENFKEKLENRLGEVGKLQMQIDRQEKERRLLKNELHNVQLNHQHTKADLLEKKKERDKFSKAEQEDYRQILRLKQEVNALIDEKSAMRVLVNRKETHLNQIKTEMSNLQKSHDLLQAEVDRNQKDLKLMRAEIRNLMTERNVLKADRENAVDVRHQLLQLHRFLNQERIKARALQEEMLTPMNIHRWRCLPGIDPEKGELLRKIQSLRKQLLNYNVVHLEHERTIKETQTLYIALKEFMVKLPSVKIKEELNEAKATIYRKNRKLKSLMAEMTTKFIDEHHKTAEIDQLKDNLAKIESKLLTERKCKERLWTERQAIIQLQNEFLAATTGNEGNIL